VLAILRHELDAVPGECVGDLPEHVAAEVAVTTLIGDRYRATGLWMVRG
jgi:hypothetical protein